MILLYRLLFLPALLLALPYYGMRMWRRGGYGRDFRHRFGLFHPLGPPADGKTRIWIQAVSVGEILAVGPLMQELKRNGKVEIVLTTTTSTGYAEARKRYAELVLGLGIFPLDFWIFSRLAWRRIRPDVILLTDSEIWPEHLHQVKLGSIPAFLVNARLSDKSFQRYKKMAPLACRLFAKFQKIFPASEYDAERLRNLGIKADRIHSLGSIKLDVALPDALSADSMLELRRELGFGGDGSIQPLILLGSSTWPGEEELLIRITTNLQARGQDVRLLLVPRHAERGPEIRRLLQEQKLRWHQRSSGKFPSGEIILHLADTTGELDRLNQIADLAFIGKSLPRNEGGQSPITAAGLGIPLLFGPRMSNFKLIAKDLVKNGAARQVLDGRELEYSIAELLSDTGKRRAMSDAGRAWLKRNRGSSRRIACAILDCLK